MLASVDPTLWAIPNLKKLNILINIGVEQVWPQGWNSVVWVSGADNPLRLIRMATCSYMACWKHTPLATFMQNHAGQCGVLYGFVEDTQHTHAAVVTSLLRTRRSSIVLANRTKNNIDEAASKFSGSLSSTRLLHFLLCAA